MFFSVLCLLCLCAPLFKCALWLPAGRGLASCLSFVVSHCEFVASPLVSWVRCGTWLYRFLNFAPLLTFITSRPGCLTLIALFLTNVCLSEFLCIFLTAHRHYLQYVILAISGCQRYDKKSFAVKKEVIGIIQSYQSRANQPHSIDLPIYQRRKRLSL